MRTLLALLLTCSVAIGSTITGTILDAAGDARASVKVTFRPKSTPTADGTSTITTVSEQATTASDGTFSVTLKQGDYEVLIGSPPTDTFTIAVPNDSSTYNINALLSSSLTYTYTTSGAALSSLSDVNLSTLSDGEVLKYDLATAKWINGVVSGGGGGGSVVLDLADDASNESSGLGEIATSGDTNSIFTEPTADKLLINLSQNWPTADTANAGDSATAFFSAGTIEHERGGLEADVSLYTGLVGISGGATSEVDTEAELETQLGSINVIVSTEIDTAAEINALTTDADFLINVVEDTTPQLGGNLDAQGNDISDLGNVTFKTGVTGGTLRTGTSNADKFELQAYDVDGAAYVKVMEADAGNNPTLEVFDETFTVRDSADETKRVEFELSGVTTGTTRTLTVADASGTILINGDIGSTVQAFDADLSDLSDGSLTGTKVGFADTNSDFTATDVQSAIEELVAVNGSGVNSATAKVDWSQLANVPAGFADGTDDTGGGGANSFETQNAPAGTDPVASSATDTLTWTVTSPLTLTGDSATDTMAFAWSGTFADAQISESSVTQHQAALALTEDQISVSVTDRLLGRDTVSGGAVEELTVGGGIEFTGSGGIQRSALTGDVTASAGSGTTTIAADSVALAADTTGNYVATVAGTSNEISVSGSGSENAAVTLSLPATIDLGGKTSVEIPNGTSGTTDATGEVYLDTNGDGGTNFSGPVVQVYDGSANKYLFPVALPLAASQDNYILKYDATGKTVQWEADATGGGGGNLEMPLEVSRAHLPTTNFPDLDRFTWTADALVYDDTADEIAYWTFRLPDSYSSTPQIILQWAMEGANTTDDVVWDVIVWARTPGDSASEATPSFDTENTSTETVPDTIGYPDTATISLTNFDSAAAGDIVTIGVRHEGSNVADTAAGNTRLLTVTFKYSQ